MALGIIKASRFGALMDRFGSSKLRIGWALVSLFFLPLLALIALAAVPGTEREQPPPG